MKEAQGPTRFRILVVDDNADVARSLSRVLALVHGQEVRVAYDGPSALAAAESFRPEIVLLDIGMPGMNGLEVATRMRKQEWCQTCLLVAVTGRSQEPDRELSAAAGFSFHLVKPVPPDTLRDLLLGRLPHAR
jgi:CheY-like chemotaxis protein